MRVYQEPVGPKGFYGVLAVVSIPFCCIHVRRRRGDEDDALGRDDPLVQLEL